MESFNNLPSTSSVLRTRISGPLEVSSYKHQEENLPLSGVICVKERWCSCLLLSKLQFPLLEGALIVLLSERQ